MEIDLFECYIYKHADSWFSIGSIHFVTLHRRSYYLFEIEWDYNKKITRLEVLGIRIK